MITYWNAFLPVGRFSDESGLDPSWAAAMGVDKDALSVLRVVRCKVLPLVRDLEHRCVLRAFSFLVHDHVSGVPCPLEDPRAYVHLRLECYHPVSGDRQCSWKPGMKKFSARDALKEWVYVSQVKPSKVELKAQETLSEQSAWYLRLVESAGDVPDVELLQRVGQALHFYANMAQMVVR